MNLGEIFKAFDFVYLEEPMSKHTSFRAGGKARAFALPKNEENILALLDICRKHQIPYFIIGNGSNLLVSDEGFDGLIISLHAIVYQKQISAYRIEAGAGILLSDLAKYAYELGLSGLEFASGIPGSLGGAVYMNAGAYDGQMKDILQEVKVIEESGEIVWIPAQELELSYRHSNIGERNRVVLAARITLYQRDKDEIAARMEELKVLRESKQPLEFPSAGSTFKRPEGYFAGKLISDAGLSGKQIGGAQVSTKHNGFIINVGDASAGDIYALICYVQKEVYKQFGISLETEVRLLGRFV